MPKNNIRLVIFDVNQTMFNLSEIEFRFKSIKLNPNSVNLWFTSILKEGFASSINNVFIDFFSIATSELVKLGLLENRKLANKEIKYILEGFNKLKINPSVRESLSRIYKKGYTAVTLTNGSKNVTEKMLEYNQCKHLVKKCFSIEDMKLWKPNKKIYKYVCNKMNCDPVESLMIASHSWDIYGAKTAGLKTGFIKNYEKVYPSYYTKPDYVGNNCLEIIKKIK